MTGFKGCIIRVNLSKQIATKESIDIDTAKKFIGGSGLSAYYYYKNIIKYQTPPEPFSPLNPLFIMNGVLTGLPLFCAARTSICSRSPLTGIWGESNVGGFFGPTLKFAGYDGIIIHGRSNHPTCLTIDDNNVEIRDATDYWGDKTYKTIKQIPDDLKSNKYQVLCIGPAGENLVKYACIMTTGGRTAGRTGMGAVMGSKNLKAIAVKGSGSIKDFNLPKRFYDISIKTHEAVKEDFMYGLLKELGTAGIVDLSLDMYGDMPIRNWSQGTFENGKNLSGSLMNETILTGVTRCFRCPIGCGREIEIPKGQYKLPKTDGPEFETLASFGTNLLIDDLKAVAYANHMANDYGIDTMSTGAVIGVLFYLIEKKSVPKSDLPSEIQCSFGNTQALIVLLHMITYRQGIGDLLAEGSKKLAEHYGKPEFAPQIAGLEAAFHDPRAFPGMGLMYVTSPRGGCHLNGDAYLAHQGLIFPEIGVKDLPDDRFENTGLAKPLINLQSYRQLFNAMGVCQFYNSPANFIADLLGIALDEKVSTSDLIIIGDRLFALKRIINILLGWKPEWQKLPSIMLKKLDGPTEGNIPDVNIQLKEWYHYRQYDFKTGKPSKKVLQQTGLLDFVT